MTESRYRDLMSHDPESRPASPVVLSDRFEQALQFAAATHRTQIRKGSGIPYVGHLLGVCSLVIEDGGSEDEAIAALLHDAAEDQGGQAMLDRDPARFGDHVADDRRGVHRHARVAQAAVAGAQADLHRAPRAASPSRCFACRSPTSCSTPARSCATTSTSAMSSGTASRPAATASSGTTASSPTASRRSCPDGWRWSWRGRRRARAGHGRAVTVRFLDVDLAWGEGSDSGRQPQRRRRARARRDDQRRGLDDRAP